MIKPALYDVIETVSPIGGDDLPIGSQGTIVFQHADDVYEVEFVNEHGETVALTTLNQDQFLVVWQAEFAQDVPLADQVAQMVARLPQQNRHEVLNFARFLSLRYVVPATMPAI
jgi:hypothetical protein